MSTFIFIKRALLTVLLLLLILLVSSLIFLHWTKETAVNVTEETPDHNETEPFPVSVDPKQKLIVEDPEVEWYVESYLSIDIEKPRHHRLVDRLLAEVAKWSWYQQLASPSSRVLVIYPGERREEVVKNIGDILKWNKNERSTFSDLVVQEIPTFEDGKFFPGRYTVSIEATPEVVADILKERFTTEILARYDSEVEQKVPLSEALVIASLLEREAYDFNDMRYISGVIWNRLFIEMPLQLDASLQYVRGSNIYEPRWWPNIRPDDKYLTSPYNTYENKGLPPTPIANPSVEAIVAALNPRETDCMFYFHDSKGGFHCSKTYQEHVANLKKIYGRGR